MFDPKIEPSKNEKTLIQKNQENWILFFDEVKEEWADLDCNNKNIFPRRSTSSFRKCDLLFEGPPAVGLGKILTVKIMSLGALGQIGVSESGDFCEKLCGN